MKDLLMKLIRYRGQYVVYGRNQAMKMLLGRVTSARREVFVGGVVSPIYRQESTAYLLHRSPEIEAQGAD